MTIRARKTCGLPVSLALIGSAAWALIAQPSAPEPVRAASVPTISSLETRLVALAPEAPRGYLELAEEVADAAKSPEELALARTLYVLAFELGRAGGSGSPSAVVPEVAASACLGLAELERLPQERRWLKALAGLQDPRYVSQDWNVPAAASAVDETAYRAATVLGLARSGEGRQAQEMLDKPGVRDMLLEYERAIGDSGLTGAMSRLEKYMRAWPCPECQNRRFVTKPVDQGGGAGGGGGGAVEARLCFTCKGNPGPALQNDELIAQLGFESVLLNGVQRSWAAQLAVDQSAPLRDPDAGELAPTYRVDPRKAYWRTGRWVDASDAGVR